MILRMWEGAWGRQEDSERWWQSHQRGMGGCEQNYLRALRPPGRFQQAPGTRLPLSEHSMIAYCDASGDAQGIKANAARMARKARLVKAPPSVWGAPQDAVRGCPPSQPTAIASIISCPLSGCRALRGAVGASVRRPPGATIEMRSACFPAHLVLDGLEPQRRGG
jgi:hypothetical protein